MSDTNPCQCKSCGPTCGCAAPRATPKAGECCCGPECTCGPDCACPPSCGCPGAKKA